VAASQKSSTGGTLAALNGPPRVAVYAADGSGTLSTPTVPLSASGQHQTIAFTYTPASGGISGGAVTLAVPAGWSAPSITGSAPGFVKASEGTVTISGRSITVSGLTRAAGNPFTITYGAKSSGGPGATAPATATGTQTWPAQQRSTAAGTLANLAHPPQIKIT
jgi:hypothetical protein